MLTEKLIITVATTGGFHGKESNPNIPLQPDEIAEEAYKCWNEGASILHVHARDENGVITNDPNVFRDIFKRVRDKDCDIVLETTGATGFADGLTEEERTLGPLESNPEMTSLDIGPAVIRFKGMEVVFPWPRSFLEKVAKVALDKNIKPEVEIGNPSALVEMENLIDKGLLKKPYWVGILVNIHKIMQGGVPYSPKYVMHLLDYLPPDSLFNMVAIGSSQLPATTLAITLGGHVRVGFEDNIYYREGELAESNAQFVARAVRIANELGREIASPDEVRELFDIPKVKA